MAKLRPAFEYLIRDEGTAYVCSPLDAGGPTKFGVTQASLATFRRHPVTVADVQALTLEDARMFYLSQYWFPLAGPSIHSQSVATAYLDMSVLVGRHAGVSLMHQALGAPYNHEILTTGKLLTAINALTSHEVIARFVADCIGHFRDIVFDHPKQGVWLNAWMIRATRLLALQD